MRDFIASLPQTAIECGPEWSVIIDDMDDRDQVSLLCSSFVEILYVGSVVRLTRQSGTSRHKVSAAMALKPIPAMWFQEDPRPQ